MGWRALFILTSPFALACGLDPSLTCGDKCSDASTSGADGSMMVVTDATVDSTVDAKPGMDAASDTSPPTDSSAQDQMTSDVICRQNGDVCSQLTPCCSNKCNATDRCTASCQGVSQSCSMQADCCAGNYCNGSSCQQCLNNGTSCTNNYQCCDGLCAVPDGGVGLRCVPS